MPSQTNVRTLLVTGANGFIGTRLCGMALDRGLRVRTFTRVEWPGEPAVPVADRFFGWLPHAIPDAALDGVDAVVHCASLTAAGSEEEARAVNVEGTAELARKAADAGVARFVFLSSQSSRADAPSAYGRTKHEAEQRLLAMQGSGRRKLDVVVLRPGLVCGPGSRGLYRRMLDMVRRMPVLPLLGGGRALVQPVHVDDTCEAALASALGAVGGPAVLHLGDPEGVTLAQFLDRLARAAGTPRPSLSVPIAPFMAVATLAESLRITLPVTRANLQGLRAVERMDTAADMARLGLKRRPVDEVIASGVAPAVREQEAPLDRRPVGVVLVGAGRIGLLHAVTASRQSGAVLSAVVDTNPKARGLLRGLGVRAPGVATLADALARGPVDAVIVATPAASHLALAEEGLRAGARVLVEKPLALRASQIASFEALDAEASGRLQVGYLAPRYPQARAALDKLRSGELGASTDVLGLTLLSLVETPSTRWEVQPEISGGGVLVNAASHVLSLVRDAFGDPDGLEATTRKVVSARVEDSACLDMAWGALRGRCLASWSIAGFPRQENRVIVTTTKGTLTLTNNVACFEGSDGRVEILHQLDHDVGFNLMPDYAGGGISAEHADIQRSVRTGGKPPMGVPEAAGVERLLFRAYDVAREGPFRIAEGATPVPGASSARASASAARDVPVGLVVDLRDCSEEDASAWARDRGVSRGGDVLVSTSQLAGALAAAIPGKRIRVTVPDFARQARLLSSGRAKDLLREMGPAGGLLAGLAAVPAVARERGATFWAAAEALLGAGLADVPRTFEGTLLVHGYLVDLALALDRPDRVRRLVAACRRRAPRARAGVHTNMLRESLRLAGTGTPVDDVHFLSSPAAREAPAARLAWERWEPGARLTAEVGPAPAAVHREAARIPEAWRHGAAGLVVGPAADASLAARLRAAREPAWRRVFPGLDMPAGLE